MTKNNSIHIKPVPKADWNAFLAKRNPRTFLQSWNWGTFNQQLNKSLGYKIFRLGIYDGGKLKGIALTIKITAKRGSFLFIPHGPILDDELETKDEHKLTLEESNIHELIHLFQFLNSLAKHEKCSFIRVSPLSLLTPRGEEIFKDLGFKRAPTHMHSELNWILDITPSEDNLLREMRKTTRYSINKAEKDGVVIETSDKLEDVKLFNSIYKSTVDRQNFTPFSLKYLEKEFETFRKTDSALLFFAKYNDEIISTAIIIFENGGAFYHQGASLLKYPKIPASYLLQWEIIKEAKRRGCTFYNFWGIAPEGKKKHPWAGLSLFKKGFGGYAEEYIPAMDLRLNSKYWLTYWIEKVRKAHRGL